MCHRSKLSTLNSQSMDKVTIEELQENFDEYLDKVEEGESFLVTSKYGEVVLTQCREEDDDDLLRMYTDHEEGS